LKTVARKPGKNSDKTGFSRTIGAFKLNQLTGQYTERQILKQLSTPSLQRKTLGDQQGPAL
jgi:hypothetical protein